MFKLRKKTKWFEVTWKYENSKDIYVDTMDELALNNIVVNDPYVEILKVEKL